MANSVVVLPPTPEECRAFISERILSGQWAPGFKLPSERVLAEQFGVSRPVVREAMKMLLAQGLIGIFPGRGSFVLELRPTGGGASIDQVVRRGDVTLRDLIDARKMVESEAAALAARHRSQAELDRMAELLAAFAAAGDGADAVHLDLAFHEAIVEASGNAVIMIMFGSIRTLVQAMVLRSLTDRHSRRAGLPLHQGIFDAISRRDSDVARRAAYDHISLAEEYYGKDLDRPIADVLNQRAASQSLHADLLRSTSAQIRDLRV